jgi:hypothetical protein
MRRVRGRRRQSPQAEPDPNSTELRFGEHAEASTREDHATWQEWPLWARLIQMFLGLGLYGLAIAFEVKARLGLDPWDVFHQGLAKIDWSRSRLGSLK